MTKGIDSLCNSARRTSPLQSVLFGSLAEFNNANRVLVSYKYRCITANRINKVVYNGLAGTVMVVCGERKATETEIRI